ncbi:Gfo/Idh/MocA family protein [Actinocrispum wychmicini]|uniref:Putative dehydrogenase n=1 Tax=Actinocrispum wychmicini TaxID=1213861 RepID=A0A4R2IKF1_9PSEU|nr:Gfo/Idh/MocA family oxidoreductase [Actinocrispum wychmicini]TCO44756.1 putative dehydrogenase [Actinocrispum wychmicini]
MSARLRVGVLGCSDVAWRRTLPALQAAPRVELVAVASRDSAKAQRFASNFSCVATTYSDLLDRDDIDAVYMPLPPALHLPWGAKVLSAGKHLLSEKPLASSAAEARQLLQRARENGVLLRENFTFLHHPQHESVRKLMASGRLGAVRSFSGAFCFPPLPASDIRYSAHLGGGSLRDAGVYPIRAAQLLFGNDLTLSGSVLRVDPGRGVDLAGQALLVSADGVPITVQFGFQHSYGSFYSVWGSAGRLHLDRAFTPPADWRPVLRIDAEEIALEPEHQFQRAVESFADAVLAGVTVTDTDEARRCADTLRTMELVDQISRQAVRVNETETADE